jgi:hypothetical protein
MAYRPSLNTKDTVMSFFKLPKPLWKLSDEEYVERCRSLHQRISQWKKLSRVFWLLIVVVMGVMTMLVVGVALDAPGEPDKSSVVQAYLIGGIAGWIMGFTLLKAVFFNVETWTMGRAYRIMVSSWDRMKELERLREHSRNSKLNTPQP